MPNEPTLAARAIAAAGNDIKRATDEAVRLLTSDDDTLHELMPRLIREWCSEQVCAHLSRIRAAAIYPAAVDQGGARLRAAMRVFLMDFPLPGTGKRLGDATGDEVGAAAAFYRGVAADASLKARWLAAVAERAEPAVVADALPEAELQELRKQADA